MRGSKSNIYLANKKVWALLLEHKRTRKTSGEAKGEISTRAKQWVVLKIGRTMGLTIGQTKVLTISSHLVMCETKNDR